MIKASMKTPNLLEGKFYVEWVGADAYPYRAATGLPFLASRAQGVIGCRMI